MLLSFVYFNGYILASFFFLSWSWLLQFYHQLLSKRNNAIFVVGITGFDFSRFVALLWSTTFTVKRNWIQFCFSLYCYQITWLINFVNPEGRQGMSDIFLPCLESQGCHLIPISSHFPAWSSYSVLSFFCLWSILLFSRKFSNIFHYELVCGFFVWLLLSS